MEIRDVQTKNMHMHKNNNKKGKIQDKRKYLRDKIDKKI